MNESRQPQAAKLSLPIVIDSGMICALALLCVWIGRQADRIENLSLQITAVQSQIQAVQASSTSTDIAALKERSVAADRQLADLKDFVGRRLDRLEAKIDSRR
jgi:cell division protein FtsB